MLTPFMDTPAEIAATKRFKLLLARCEFIEAFGKVSPEVFEALHQEPLRLYRLTPLPKLPVWNRETFWRKTMVGNDRTWCFDGRADNALTTFQRFTTNDEHLKYHFHLFASDVLGLNFNDEPQQSLYLTEAHPQLVAWLESLKQWGETYHLKDGWLMHWAFMKLDRAAQSNDVTYDNWLTTQFGLPDFGYETQPRVPTPQEINARIDKFKMESLDWQFRGWERFETRRAYEKAVRAQFELELKKYFSEFGEGYGLTPRKNDHYRWLAHFQCKRDETQQSTAKAFNCEDSTLQEALKLKAAPASARNLHGTARTAHARRTPRRRPVTAWPARYPHCLRSVWERADCRRNATAR